MGAALEKQAVMMLFRLMQKGEDPLRAICMILTAIMGVVVLIDTSHVAIKAFVNP